MFIVEGALTVAFGFLGYVLLPDYPHNTKFLSEAQRALAVYRLSKENDGDDDEVTESVWIGLKQAVTDPMVWLLVLILTGAVVSMSFTCKYMHLLVKYALPLTSSDQIFFLRSFRHWDTREWRRCCLQHPPTSWHASTPLLAHGTAGEPTSAASTSWLAA